MAKKALRDDAPELRPRPKTAHAVPESVPPRGRLPGPAGARLARGRFRRLGDIFRRRGRNRRLGVQIRALFGRFRRLGDQNGRKKRLGDGKRLPIVQNVHEAHQMTPNRAKRPRPEARAITDCEV